MRPRYIWRTRNLCLQGIRMHVALVQIGQYALYVKRNFIQEIFLV